MGEECRLPEDIPLVVVGTGTRFQEIYKLKLFQGFLAGVSVKYSPFCGSPDGLEPNGDVIMAGGALVSLSDYINVQSRYFDSWSFICDLPDNTLLCSGSDLMIALGLKSINEKGQLFKLDPKTETGEKIS